MKSFSRAIELATRSKVEFIEITDEVQAAFAESGIRDGLVTIFTQHTTTAIRVNERESRLQQDMLALFDSLASPGAQYRHDLQTLDNRANAWGHLISLLLGSSESIPLTDGKWGLGDWQSVFFVELDGPRPKRTVLVQVIGE